MPSNRLTVTPFLIGSAVLVLLVVGLVIGIRWRQSATDTSSAVPFRPQVTYESQLVSVVNTEDEPYFDVSLHVYVEGTLYSAQVGTIEPGATIRRDLRDLENTRGAQLDLTRPGISELEVRARFKGYAVHKDFPPPH